MEEIKIYTDRIIGGGLQEKFYDYQIKSIVTKEQFEGVKFEV